MSVAVLFLLCFASSSTLAQNASMVMNGGYFRVADIAAPPNPAANPAAYQNIGSAVTVEAWIYPTILISVPYGQEIIRRPTVRLDATDSSDAYGLYISYDNGYPQLTFSISDGSPGVRVFDPDTLKPFVWSHVSGTYDGTTLKLYVNGALKAQRSASLTITSSGIGLYIGYAFRGLMDDVRLWNVARSAAEITGSMNTQLTGAEPGLAGNWKMDTTYHHPVSNIPITPDATVNGNDLMNGSGMPTLPYDHTNTGTASASITPSSFDFGSGHYQGDNVSVPITIDNSSSNPLFGAFVSQSTDLAASSGAYYVPPMSSLNTTAVAKIQTYGNLSGALTFVGNIAASQNFNFTVQAYPLPTIDANNVFMWLSNTGGFARNGLTQGAGLEWPKGSGKTAVYASGIWLAATVSGAVRTATAGYQTEFRAGPIVGGVPADPTDRRYRVYKIQSGDNASNPDYAEWPVDLGAPVQPDSTPAIFGDQTLFSVYNDANPVNHNNVFQTAPLGAEVQQTTFAFNQPGPLQNTIFLRFKIINKSINVWQNAYVGLWADPDLGNYSDDLVGIDTSRSLGYTYNGTPTDPDIGGVLGYGSTPPALGYDILKGAFYTKPIQSFVRWVSGFPEGDPSYNSAGAQHVYYSLQGLLSDGSPYIDPTTSMATPFPFAGDPVTGTGWLDSVLGDRRFLFSTGPFNLEPGQSKEMIAAIIVAQGTDNLNSITALRNASDQIQALYDGGQVFGGAVQSVVSTSVAQDDSTTLDDLANSGAQFDVKGGTGGATVEAASYVEAPPGASSITTPAVTGVGKYVEVQVDGTVQWPVEIRIYYTANDLNQAGVTEGDLNGIYYWNGASSQWILYSNSGADDQGRGPSTTGVNTTNVTLNGVNYEGYVYASAYHLTPIVIGANVPQTPQVPALYQQAIGFLASLPDNAFLHPAGIRRAVLIKGLEISQRFYERGRRRFAAAFLAWGELNIVRHRHSWIKDASARSQFIAMLRNLIHTLGQPASQAAVQEQLSIFEEPDLVPRELALSEAYPNPFNPETKLQFTVPEDGKALVRVFNMLGEQVQVLFNEPAKAGQRYVVKFNGSKLASGMYFVRLEFSGKQIVRKLLLTK